MSDELADLITPHWRQSAPPSPALDYPAGELRYGQGVVVEWDPVTFENRVRFHGTELENLPVGAGVDGLAIAPGDVVRIEYTAPAGGAGQYMILPPPIMPGSGAAQRAIAAMRTRLVQQLSAEFLAARTYAAVVPDQIVVTSTTFTAMSGPVIEGIEVSAGGVMLIWIDADIRVSTFDQGDSEGSVAPAISGATVLPAGFIGDRSVQLNRGTNNFNTAVSAGGAGLFVATGLSPGLHDVEVYYKTFTNAGGNPAVLFNRRLAVLAL